MKCIYRWKIALLACCLLLPALAHAQDQLAFTIQANQSAIEVIGEAAFNLAPSKMFAGANMLYKEDEYSMLGIHTMVGNAIHTQALTGKIGFKGVVGEVERSGSDSDLLALAFSVAAVYDLSDVVAAYYIPLSLSATLNIAPQPLAFSDTDEFVEGIAALDWRILENGIITLSYRYIEMDFEDRRGEWQMNDSEGYLGFKFLF